MARRKRKSSAVIAIVLVIILIAVFVGGWYLYTYQRPIFDEIYNTILGKKDNEMPGEPDKPPVIVDGDLSIHFLELGNNYTGDCIYIKAGDTDVLVDAGSRAGSVDTIQTYLKDYVKDDILEYVVVTHADQDHIAGFGASKSIFDLYECKTIIQFAKTKKSEYNEKGNKTLYKKYLEKRDAEVAAGAVCYTALECYRETNGAKKTYQLSDDVTMNILYQEFYENSSSDENNYSVCFLLTHGDRNFLFTGDLEKKGEESLVANNKLPEVELFKAGHHGSPTSSNDILLSVIKPKIVCVCCCAGSVEYTQNSANTFPSQAFINRIAIYTDKVYVTTMVNVVFDAEKNKVKDAPPRELLNGNIVVSSGKEGINVNCTNNNTVLKDTEWFKNNRTLPDAWKAAA